MYLMVLKNCKHIMSFWCSLLWCSLIKNTRFFGGKIFLFFYFIVYTNMRQTKCENNTISNKKSEIKAIINDFKEIIRVHGFKYNKKG